MIRSRIAVSLFLFVLVTSGPVSASIDSLVSESRIILQEEEVWRSYTNDFNQLRSEYQYLDSLEFFRIQYLSEGHLVKGLVIRPRKSGLYPTIVFNRGGNRTFGQLTLKTLIDFTGQIAVNGFTIVASNYRTEDEFGGRDVNDVLHLIDILPSISKADTSSIGMLGWSRGGMMAYLCMAKTKKLKTVVVGNGPTDLRRTLEERPVLEASVFSECIPDYWNEKDKALSQRSVIDWVDNLNRETSLLILAGTADKRVSYKQAQHLASILKETSLHYKYSEFITDHFFSDRRKELQSTLLAWFNEHLK